MARLFIIPFKPVFEVPFRLARRAEKTGFAAGGQALIICAE